jgi:hypothetical protein
MQNQTLIEKGREILKELLSQCTEKQQRRFKQMYAYPHLDMPINEAVDRMDPNKIDCAISQCENTIRRNKLS